MQPRLQSGGWFTRGFATTSGILAALALFLIVMPIAALTIFAEYLEAVRESPEVADGKLLPAIVVKAQDEARPQLRRMGLRRFEYSFVQEDGKQLTLVAKSPDEAGTLRPVSFTFDTSGENWELLEYSLDGKTFRRKQ